MICRQNLVCSLVLCGLASIAVACGRSDAAVEASPIASALVARARPSPTGLASIQNYPPPSTELAYAPPSDALGVPTTFADGPATTAEGLRPAAQLGIVVDQNMRVVTVEPNSAAQQAGIQVGDIIMVVDEFDLKVDVVQAKQRIANTNAQGVSIQLQRKSQLFSVTVYPKSLDFSPNTDVALPTATPVIAPYEYL